MVSNLGPKSEQIKTIYLATLHGKGLALAPSLKSLGYDLREIKVETDTLGTFSGEVPRKGSVEEVLREKAKLAYARKPEARLLLSSEGSFFPAPGFPWMTINREDLLLTDMKEGWEIFASYSTQESVAVHEVLHQEKSLGEILRLAKFPSHAICVYLEEEKYPIFKGIREPSLLGVALEVTRKKAAGKHQIVIANDLRADRNPTRMKAIESAGQELVRKLSSNCPSCQTPGFWSQRAFDFLACSDCGQEGGWPKHFLWTCPKCDHQEVRPRLDRVDSMPAEFCQFCNP